MHKFEITFLKKVMYFETTIGNKLHHFGIFYALEIDSNSVHLLQNIMVIFKTNTKWEKNYSVMYTLLSLKFMHKLLLYIYMYMYVYICIYVYIYIYASFGNFMHFRSFGKMWSDPPPMLYRSSHP